MRNGLIGVHWLLVYLLFFSFADGLFFGWAGASVSIKQDKDVDITEYKTYRWIGEREAKSLKLDNPYIDYITGYSRIIQRPDIEDALKTAVNRELKTKGMTEVTSSPDFYVTYYGKAKDEEWVSTWSGSVPSITNVPLVMYPDFDRSSTREYRDGNLLLVFYDPKTKKPVWTGTMPKVLKKKSLNLETVTAGLSELTKEFTPTG